MAGHNKWSKIKRKKAVNDAKRSKIITKILKEITIAVREGGPNPEANPRLRLAMQNAKKYNTPKDLISRAINKTKDADALKETRYEGYGPGGVAIIVECATDNINRTVSQVRSAFTRGGGNLGSTGSVSYMFERKAIFNVKKDSIKDLDEFELEMVDAGAEDIEEQDDLIIITADFKDNGAISKKLQELGVEIEEANISWIPTSTVSVDVEQGKKVLSLVERLEDLDDVQQVFHNLELTEELENALM